MCGYLVLLLEKPPLPIPPTTSHHTTPHPLEFFDYKCNSCDGDVGMTCRLPFVFFNIGIYVHENVG